MSSKDSPFEFQTQRPSPWAWHVVLNNFPNLVRIDSPFYFDDVGYYLRGWAAMHGQKLGNASAGIGSGSQLGIASALEVGCESDMETASFLAFEFASDVEQLIAMVSDLMQVFVHVIVNLPSPHGL